MENIYTLPEITFVAGEKKTIQINLMTPKPYSVPFDVGSCNINLSIIDYSNKIGEPVISKLCSSVNNKDGIACIAIADLLPLETLHLYGKYIYQVTIIDTDGNTEIPGQGKMYIAKNINTGFLENHNF